MTISKIAKASALAAVALFTLAGCSFVSAEEAASTPNSVLQTDNGGLFDGDAEWIAYDGAGNAITLECSKEIFKPTICSSIDGVRQLSYRTYKSRLRDVELTVDGSLVELSCGRTESFGDRVCVPKA